MGDYEVMVFTGNMSFASTFNKVYIKLVGTDGASERTHLWSCVPSFYRGAVSHFIVSCQKSLGQLVLIELDKERHTLVPNKAWYPAKVDVTSPEGEAYHFPVYQWISDSSTHYFREGADICTPNKLLALEGYCCMCVCCSHTYSKKFVELCSNIQGGDSVKSCFRGRTQSNCGNNPVPLTRRFSSGNDRSHAADFEHYSTH